MSQIVLFRYRQGMRRDDIVSSAGFIPAAEETVANLTHVNVEEGVTRIEDSAFDNDTDDRGFSCHYFDHLQEVSLAQTVETIGTESFVFCDNMVNLVIPRNSRLVRIKDRAFLSCQKLEGSLTLPTSLKYMGSNVFYNCGALGDVTFAGDENQPSQLETMGQGCFCGVKAKLIDFTHCVNLKVITRGSFTFSEVLETVLLPPNLEILAKNAFDHCTSLRRLVFPATLREIQNEEERTFRMCIKLTSIEFKSTLVLTPRVLQGKPFHPCKALSTVILPRDAAETPAKFVDLAQRLFLDRSNGLLAPNSSEENRLNCLFLLVKSNTNILLQIQRQQNQRTRDASSEHNLDDDAEFDNRVGATNVDGPFSRGDTSAADTVETESAESPNKRRRKEG